MSSTQPTSDYVSFDDSPGGTRGRRGSSAGGAAALFAECCGCGALFKKKKREKEKYYVLQNQLVSENSLKDMYNKGQQDGVKRTASLELVQKFVARDAVETHYSPDEMRALVSAFRTHCDDKANETMSSAAFQKLFDVPPKLCQEIFGLFDENRSGTLVCVSR